ncbi:hypothetical protein RB298_30355 [Priestia sp. BR_2]
MENFRATTSLFGIDSSTPLVREGPPSSPNEDGGRGQNAAQQSVRSYINQANEPFGAYIPNGSFAFTPSPNHRQGGSNHPRRMVEAREAKLGAEQRRPRLATKHGIAVFRMPTP